MAYDIVLDILDDIHMNVNNLIRVVRAADAGSIDVVDVGKVNFSTKQKSDLLVKYKKLRGLIITGVQKLP